MLDYLGFGMDATRKALEEDGERLFYNVRDGQAMSLGREDRESLVVPLEFERALEYAFGDVVRPGFVMTPFLEASGDGLATEVPYETACRGLYEGLGYPGWIPLEAAPMMGAYMMLERKSVIAALDATPNENVAVSIDAGDVAARCDEAGYAIPETWQLEACADDALCDFPSELAAHYIDDAIELRGLDVPAEEAEAQDHSHGGRGPRA